MTCGATGCSTNPNCNGNVLSFNYTDWSAMYPELASSVSQPQAQMYFYQAQLYVDNTPTSVFTDCSQGGSREMFLNMITAHICALNASLNGQPPNPLVGRISNATEGSVSVASEMNYPPGSAQWYISTKYGAQFWAATARYRTMRYVSGTRGPINPFNFGR